MNRIAVPPAFVRDFDLYVARSGMDRWAEEDLRFRVREDYETWAPIISRQASVYRFIDETWGPTLGKGKLPTAKLAIGYLASKGYFMEPEAERLCGLGLLLEKCAEVAGAISSASSLCS